MKGRFLNSKTTTMQIKGTIIALLPLQTGQGKNGQWRKQDIIIETQDQYPKKVCISIWGDKINESQLQIGNELNVSFDIESREYNGRYYTEVKAFKIESVGKQNTSKPNQDEQQYRAHVQERASEEFDETDLPF